MFSAAGNWDPATAPAGGDATRFTNDTTYTVTFTGGTSKMSSNIVNSHAGIITFDIGSANSWTITNQQAGAGAGGFVVGSAANTTGNVYIASGSLNVTGITGAAFIKIGG